MSLSAPTKAFITTIIVADLFAIAFFGGTWLLTGSVLPHKDEHKTIVAGAAEAGHSAAGTEVAAAAEPAFDPATYTADVGRGEKIAAKCKACHSFDNGGPNRVGPNQWHIVGGPLAHAAGFNYSAALLEKKKAVPNWTPEALDAFLANPREWMPGNKMQFAGIKNPAERADLIAWLKTLK
jgi:cytochrome c